MNAGRRPTGDISSGANGTIAARGEGSDAGCPERQPMLVRPALGQDPVPGPTRNSIT